MIKKAALKATVGTAAASLLFLPGATMVASPSIELMACTYPDSRGTVTQQSIEKPIVRKRQSNRSFVQVTADRGVPKGTVTLKFAKENRRGDYIAKPGLRKTKRINDAGRVRFNISNLNVGQWRVIAKFDGTCRFRSSSDTDFVTVLRPRR